ncbi:MAG: RNA polymerase sigma factor SigJ [Gimesia sp.]
MKSASGVDTFELHRPALIGLAYRITGSRMEAEDLVQETFLKWNHADRSAIVSAQAWLMKVTTRLALDYLKSAKVKRLSYIGPWLPEPFLADESTPEKDLELDESISMALLVLLEQLSPAERASYILHDLFQYRFDEIGEILERSEGSCRKLASRARMKIGRKKMEVQPDREEHLQLQMAFFEAVKQGETEGLVALLKENATFHSDGGGKAAASRKVLQGSEVIAKFFLKVVRPYLISAEANEVTISTIWFNGAPGMIVRESGTPVTAFNFEFDQGSISGIYALRNPDKLCLFGPVH